MQTDSPASFQSLPEGPLRLIASKLSLRGKFALSLVCSDARRILVADPDPGCMGKLHVRVEPPHVFRRNYTRDQKLEVRTIHVADDLAPAPCNAATVIVIAALAPPDERSAIIRSVRRRLASFASASLDIGQPMKLTSLEDVRTYRSVFPVWAELCGELSCLTYPAAAQLRLPLLTVRHRVSGEIRDKSFLAPFLEPLSRLRGLKVGVDLTLASVLAEGYFDFEHQVLSLFENLSHLSHVRVSMPDGWNLSALSVLSSIPSLDLRPSCSPFCDTQFSKLKQLANLKSLDLRSLYVDDPIEQTQFIAIADPLTSITRLSVTETTGTPLQSLMRVFPNVTSLVLHFPEGSSEEFAWQLVLPEQFGPVPNHVSDITISLELPCKCVRDKQAHFHLPTDALSGLSGITSLTITCIYLPFEEMGFSYNWQDFSENVRLIAGLGNPLEPDQTTIYGLKPRIRFSPDPSLCSLTNLKSLRFEAAFQPPRGKDLNYLPSVALVLPPDFSYLTALTSLRADGLSDFIDQDLPPQMRGEGRVRMRTKRPDFVDYGMGEHVDIVAQVRRPSLCTEVFCFGTGTDV